MKLWRKKFVILIVAGIFFIITGIAIVIIWRYFCNTLNNTIDNNLPLTSNSSTFQVWKSINDTQKSVEFYFFNWTNPEEFKIKGKKPNFIEVGPYTITENKRNVNIIYPENFWYFDTEKSNGSLNDNIIQLDIVLLSAVYEAQYWSPYYQDKLSSILLNESTKIHVVKTVNELLFTGYEESWMKIMMKSFNNTYTLPTSKNFGWIHRRDGLELLNEHFNMVNVGNIKDLGMIMAWNNELSTNYKNPCKKFVKELKSSETSDINAWIFDFFRPLIYEYTDTVMHQGILGYQYTIGEKTLSNSTKRHYPHDQAKCFEITTTTEDFFDAKYSTTESNEDIDDPDTINMDKYYCNGECSPMGVINIAACRYGAPGFISLPHFYKGDPILREQVTGMNPNEQNHSFYITLEPNTGVPLDVAARFQINILIQPSLNVALFHDVPKIYFPLFWFNINGEMTDNIPWNFTASSMFSTTLFYIGITVIIIGFLIFIITIIELFIRNNTQKYKISSHNDSHLEREKKNSIILDTMSISNGHYWNDRLI